VLAIQDNLMSSNATVDGVLYSTFKEELLGTLETPVQVPETLASLLCMKERQCLYDAVESLEMETKNRTLTSGATLMQHSIHLVVPPSSSMI
jgi:hypothetical protein